MSTKTPTFPKAVAEAMDDLPLQFALGIVMLPGYYGNCYAVAQTLGLDADRFIEKAAPLEKACEEAGGDTAQQVLAWLRKLVEPMEERYNDKLYALVDEHDG